MRPAPPPTTFHALDGHWVGALGAVLVGLAAAFGLFVLQLVLLILLVQAIGPLGAPGPGLPLIHVVLGAQSLALGLGFSLASRWTAAEVRPRGLELRGWGRRSLVPWGAIVEVRETLSGNSRRAGRGARQEPGNTLVIHTRTRGYALELDVVDRAKLIAAIAERCPGVGVARFEGGVLVERDGAGARPHLGHHVVTWSALLWIASLALVVGILALDGRPDLVALFGGGGVLGVIGALLGLRAARGVELMALAPERAGAERAARAAPVQVDIAAVAPDGAAPRCPFCLDDLAALDDRATCAACATDYHAECWGELSRRCGVLGCGGRAATVRGAAVR